LQAVSFRRAVHFDPVKARGNFPEPCWIKPCRHISGQQGCNV